MQCTRVRMLIRLQRGAFSTVYRVVDKETKKEYALKVMDRPPKHDKGKNKIINIEIEILMRLNHPNCVKLFAVFNNVDKISLVIQLCVAVLCGCLHSRDCIAPYMRGYTGRLC